ADATGRSVSHSVAGLYGQVTGLAPAMIQYFKDDVIGVTIKTGTVSNTVNLQATNVPLNLIGNATILGGHDMVNVGNAGSLTGLLADINISNPSWFSDVVIDGSADPSRSFTLSSFSVSGDANTWGRVRLSN